MKDSPQSNFTLMEFSMLALAMTIAFLLFFRWDNTYILKSQLLASLSNARQIQLAAMECAEDGQEEKNPSFAWPGDLTGPDTPSGLSDYAIKTLVNYNYLPNDFRVFISPGILGAETGKFCDANNAFSMAMSKSETVGDCPFVTSKNFDPTSQILGENLRPFRDEGFVVVRKDGSGGIYHAPEAKASAMGQNHGYVWGVDPSTCAPPVVWKVTGQ